MFECGLPGFAVTHSCTEVLAYASWVCVRITRGRPHLEVPIVHLILCSTLLLTVSLDWFWRSFVWKNIIEPVILMAKNPWKSMKFIQKSRAKHKTPWFSASFPFNPPTQTQPSPQPRRSPPLRPPHVTCGCAWRENSPGNGKNDSRIPGLPSGNLWMSCLLTMMILSQITRGCMIWCFLLVLISELQGLFRLNAR